MLKRDLSQLEELLKSLPVAAFVCSNDGVIECYNDHAATLWGRRPLAGDSAHPFCGEPHSDLFEQVIATGRGLTGDAVFARVDGAHVPYRAYSQPLINEDGRIDATLTIVQEASDVGAAGPPEPSGLAESVIRAAAEGICVFRVADDFPNIQFTLWNDRMTEFTGYTMEELNESGWMEPLFPTAELQAQTTECFDQLRAGKDLHNQEVEILRRDGASRILSISTSPMGADDGVRTFTALMSDVTEQRRNKNALIDSEERLKLAMEATELGLWDWDLLTNEAYFSPEWKRQLGYGDSELKRGFLDWRDRLHPDDKDRVLGKLDDYLQQRAPRYDLEFRLLHRDGSYRWIHACGVAKRDPDGHVSRMLGCHVDISAHKRTEHTLRDILESVSSSTGQEFFANLVEYLARVCEVDIAIVAELPKPEACEANTLAIQCHGRSEPNIQYMLAGTPCEAVREAKDICYFEGVQEKFPEDRLLAEMNAEAYLGIPLWSGVEPIGLMLLIHSQPIGDLEHAKSMLRVLGARCGAEMKRFRAEEQRERSELKLKSIAATMPMFMYVVNLRTKEVEYTNRRTRELMGEAAALGTGDTWSARIHPEDAARVEGFLERLASCADGEVMTEQFRFKNTTGAWRWLSTRATVFERNAAGDVISVVGNSEDITDQLQAEAERKRFQSQLQHAQKLRSLGMLAGGVAHDFNNLLAALQGFAEAALQATQDGEARSHVQDIIRGVNNATELTEQMLAYAGHGQLHVRPVDISELVSETSRLLRISVSKYCHLDLRLADRLPACEVDVAQLRQVVMNLIINASEAIGNSQGVITVSTSLKSLPCGIPNLTGEVLPAGNYICLTVADDGNGMSEETQERIFDPFYTTKFSGRGLGMSTVLGIVRGHHGGIQLESKPGVGTTFRVYLPVASEKTRPSGISTPTNVGRALVADDEQAVLQSIGMLVKSLGYDLTLASTCHQLLDILAKAPHTYDVIMLDLALPDMDVVSVCAQIRQQNPNARIIFMSGSGNEDVREAMETFSPDCLRKPFNLDELECVLGDVSKLP